MLANAGFWLVLRQLFLSKIPRVETLPHDRESVPQLQPGFDPRHSFKFPISSATGAWGCDPGRSQVVITDSKSQIQSLSVYV
jgi:hypothetical protein